MHGDEMSQELNIEMPQQQGKKKIWRNPRALAIIILAALVILAGIFSWWLSRGKVSSAAARLDTIVYTVEPDFPTRLENVYVKSGESVKAGQPLGRIDLAPQAFVPPPPAHAAPSGNRHMPDMQDISERLAAAQLAEKSMASKVAQARAEEEKTRQLWQDLVTEHVRAQLAMRSLDSRNPAYAQARQVEEMARSRMESAKDIFEKISISRAAMDHELNRIRAELARVRQRTGSRIPATKTAESKPEFHAESNLYSPVDGKVMRINAAPGQMLAKGEPVFLILPTGREYASESWIQAWFPVEDKGRIHPGQKVSIRFAGGEAHISGKVQAVGDAAQGLPEQATGEPKTATASSAMRDGEEAKYLPVKITIDNPAEIVNLPPGTKAECQIQTRYILGKGGF